MSEISVEEQIRVIESLMFVVEGHDWEGSDNRVISVILEQEEGKREGVLLRKDCPGAARDRINLAQETTKINEKKLRIDQEAYKFQLDVAKKRGDTRSAEFLEGKLKEITTARRRNLENMDKLESIASDYAVKHKPGDDKWEQRSHAIFLEKHMRKMTQRLAKEEAAEFPNPDTIEKLQRRMERMRVAQTESERWLGEKDPVWNKAFKEGSVGEEDIKAAVKAKREELQAKLEGGTGAAGATGAPEAKPVSGTTGEAAPAPTPAPEPEAKPEEKPVANTAAAEKEMKRNPALKVAMNAEPGTVWKTEGGFAGKNMSGKVGSDAGVKYFPTEKEAEGFAKNTGNPPGSRRTNATGRKPVEKKLIPSGTGESPKPRKKAVSKKSGARIKDITSKAIELSKSKSKPRTIVAGDLTQEIVGKYLQETYRKSGLGKWFRQSADDTPGWDRYNTAGKRVGKCGDADEGEAYAACLSPEKAEKLGKEGIASFVRRKRAAQKEAGMAKKGEGEAGGGAEPVRVSTGVDKVDEGWSQEYKDSIDCGNPKGFSQRAHCEGREKSMSEGKEVSTDELKSAVQELIALIKKHEKLAYEARKAGNTKEYNRQRGIVAEFSAEIKTVQDIIKRTLKSGKTTLTITEEDGEEKPLNKPFRTPGEKKKFAVYVRNDNGNIVKVRFGDPNMEIKRDDPARLKAFRSRHSCDDDVGPKWKARYWSCQMWRSDKSVDDILSEAAKNEPTNPELWEKVQDLVAGRTSSMEHGGETIEGPNEGKGFDVHPSAYSNAWAAKLYKRLGGGWRAVSEESMKELVRSVVSKTLSESAEAEETVKKKIVYDLDGKSKEEVETFLERENIEYIEEDGVIYVFSDDEDGEELQEAAAKRRVVIRKGQRKIIFKCPPGKKKVGARTCIVRKASERMKLSRKAVRSARKSRSKRARANRLRKRSNIKRAAMGLNKKRR